MAVTKSPLSFYVMSAKFAKNENAQLQKTCSFKKKTNCIFEFSITKLGKNKCRCQCNKNCVTQWNLCFGSTLWSIFTTTTLWGLLHLNQIVTFVTLQMAELLVILCYFLNRMKLRDCATSPLLTLQKRVYVLAKSLWVVCFHSNVSFFAFHFHCPPSTFNWRKNWSKFFEEH